MTSDEHHVCVFVLFSSASITSSTCIVRHALVSNSSFRTACIVAVRFWFGLDVGFLAGLDFGFLVGVVRVGLDFGFL